MDYRKAQSAAKRVGGIKFKLSQGLLGRWGATRSYKGKLTRESVRKIRDWSGREGYIIPTRIEQARVIQKKYPYVSERTMYDILSNGSWYDTTYVPGTPDVSYWLLPPAILLLHIIINTPKSFKKPS